MKRILTFFAVALALIIAPELLAQKKKAQQKETPPSDKGFPNTLQQVNPAQHYEPKVSKKKKKKGLTYDAQNQYYNRVENTWREREKREKSFERGDATDFMKPPYFGHKKPPKIRPIEKRKYCKICGIRH